MKCELCFDNCLDLPSLTQIQGNQDGIHAGMGYVILESMIWFDLIWLDIPNLTENNIHYGKYSFESTADLQAISISYDHSYYHSIDADGLRNVVLDYSQYDLVNAMKQSKEQYFILQNQSFDDIEWYWMSENEWKLFVEEWKWEWMKSRLKMNKQVELQFSSSSFSEGEKCGFL